MVSNQVQYSIILLHTTSRILCQTQAPRLILYSTKSPARGPFVVSISWDAHPKSACSWFKFQKISITENPLQSKRLGVASAAVSRPLRCFQYKGAMRRSSQRTCSEITTGTSDHPSFGLQEPGWSLCTVLTYGAPVETITPWLHIVIILWCPAQMYQAKSWTSHQREARFKFAHSSEHSNKQKT